VLAKNVKLALKTPAQVTVAEPWMGPSRSDAATKMVESLPTRDAVEPVISDRIILVVLAPTGQLPGNAESSKP